MITKNLALVLLTKPQSLLRFHGFTCTHLVSILWSHVKPVTMWSPPSGSSSSPIDNPPHLWPPSHFDLHLGPQHTTVFVYMCLGSQPAYLNVIAHQCPGSKAASMGHTATQHSRSHFSSPPCNCLSPGQPPLGICPSWAAGVLLSVPIISVPNSEAEPY